MNRALWSEDDNRKFVALWNSGKPLNDIGVEFPERTLASLSAHATDLRNSGHPVAWRNPAGKRS